MFGLDFSRRQPFILEQILVNNAFWHLVVFFWSFHNSKFSIRFCHKMAKWGEGDPRWIVEERPDATNVNNWHW